jgi:hydroxyacylglutathione hydrolase
LRTFALTVEPNNSALSAREAQAKQQVQEGQPTIPVTIGDEKLANPFLRADRPDVAVGVGMAGKPAVDVFAEIRARKNKF